MSDLPPAATTLRRTRSSFVAVLLVVAALAAALGFRSLASSSSGAGPVLADPFAHASPERLSDPPGRLPRDRGAALGIADGEVPDGVTVFDQTYPAVSNLDPALLSALRRAATDAAGDGVQLFVNSGWRSPAYQEQLLDEAVSKY